MHVNSLKAYSRGNGKFTPREQLIYTTVLAKGPMTDRQVMHELRFPDTNSVRPRITELLKDLWLIEAGSVICPTTGCRVRKVQARSIEARSLIIRDIEEANKRTAFLTQAAKRNETPDLFHTNA